MGILIVTLDPVEMLALTQPEAGPNWTPEEVLLAYLAFYDQRGGAAETSFKGDKQGLGITKRAKKRFAAQQMVMLLGFLAQRSQAQTFRIKRMVRDIFHLNGFLVHDASGSFLQIALNRAAPLAVCLREPLEARLASAHVAVTLDKT